MKFIRPQKPDAAAGAFAFHITPREKELLAAVLHLYPQIEPGYHRLGKKPGDVPKTQQEWLEEAMEEQRQSHARKLSRFFSNDRRFFKESNGGLRLSLTGEQMEWLLQVLNDVRVGSWAKLGGPELEELRKTPLQGKRAQLFSAMELSGYFQAVLLEAFS